MPANGGTDQTDVSRKDVLWAFWEQAKPYTWWWVALVGVYVLANGTEMLEPWVVKWLVDGMSGPRGWEFVLWPIVAFAVLRVGNWALMRIVDDVQARFATRMYATARRRIFDLVIRREFSYFADTPAGGLIHSMNRFVDGMDEFFNLLLYSALPVVIAVVSTLVSFWLRSPWLALGFVAWLVLLVCVQLAIAKRQERLRRRVATAEEEASAYMADAVGNAPMVKTFAVEQRESGGLWKKLSSVASLERDARLKDNWYWGAQWFCFLLLEILAVGGVAWGWVEGRFTVGDLVLVQTFIVILYRVLGNLTRTFRRLPRQFTQSETIVRLMKEEAAVQDAPGARPLRVREGEIRFNDVSFRYKDGRVVLKDFSLQIRPKEKVALVGPSGAGKSTVVKLLYRFYDPQQGHIDVDGQDVARVTQESLRRQLALVPQDPVLFHRSILDNIRYARPSATKAQVVAAAKRAHCHGFISQLPDGYDSLVGERGVKLSGGERQRVAIARAILADTPILVLDEATSSLDSESEGLIQAALRELMRDKTVIVIAHRLSTIMEMDRIVVVENGRVADQGTHAQLLDRIGTYKRLWNLQSGGYAQEE